jgi:hypothetical protein
MYIDFLIQSYYNKGKKKKRKREVRVEGKRETGEGRIVTAGQKKMNMAAYVGAHTSPLAVSHSH